MGLMKDDERNRMKRATGLPCIAAALVAACALAACTTDPDIEIDDTVTTVVETDGSSVVEETPETESDAEVDEPADADDPVTTIEGGADDSTTTTAVDDSDSDDAGNGDEAPATTVPDPGVSTDS